MHIGYEEESARHQRGRKSESRGFWTQETVVSVMPMKTWERKGFMRKDLIPTNGLPAAAIRGAIYVAGETPKTVLHMGGRYLWMSFLVVEN